MPVTSASHPSPPPTAATATGEERSPGWLDLPRGWLFEHLHEAVLVVELGTGRVELANPAARRLFGAAAVGASVGQLMPGLLESGAWQRLARHAQAEARLLDLADSYPRQPDEQRLRRKPKPTFEPASDASPRRMKKPAGDAAWEARPHRFDDVPPEAAAWTRIAPDQAHAEVLAGLSLRSAVRLPLVVRGHILGGMLFAASAGRRYSDADLRLAQAVARRCALAIDNARLYCVAQQAIAARDQFVAIASHELRAPLTRLKSHVEVLLLAQAEGELDPERLDWSLRRINAAADRLAALARDLLDVSRLNGAQEVAAVLASLAGALPTSLARPSA